MEAWCKQIYEAEDELSVPINEFVEYCETHIQEVRNFKSLLYAVHICRWDDFLCVLYDLDEVFCLSMYTFYCTLLAYPIPEIPSQLELANFPLITIHPRWIHETVQVSVCNMSQQVVLDTLFGIEWHMSNDIMFTRRTDEWLTQARHLFHLLKERIAVLSIGEHECDVLDMEEYRTILEHKQDTEQENEVEVYDSDDETYKTKIQAKEDDIDVTLFQSKLATITPSFIFICDTFVTSIDLLLYGHFNDSPLQATPHVSLDRFRGWLFREMKSINEAKICGYQSTWFETLVVTNTYIRVFQYSHGKNVLINKRNILLVHNEDFLPPPVSTFREIEERPIKDVQKKIQLVSDGVFVCFSLQFDSLVKILHWTGITSPKEGIYIYRDRLRNVWIYQLNKAERWSCASLLHAFVGLRRTMQSRELSPMCRGVNISAFDEQIKEFIL